MSDFDRNNSLNSNENDEILNDNNGDSDNNITQNVESDGTAANTIHRNNFTARDHLFQAMFSRIALTYDRTFPPFARRFIEFMLLITALSVLFILIYIHLAFVKAPITCLDNFSFEELVGHDEVALKHMVIRVEILSNPPINYGLFNSYSKEYDDMNTATDFDKNSSSVLSSKNHFTQLALFLNIIYKKCHKGIIVSDKDGKVISEGKENSQTSENDDQNQSEGSFFKLFHFPINPIIEKAEYWREKLSVRAMAPFRQTFNDLELFAKSVFTEEKYIMEYSLEYGLLRLSPQTRERLNIPVHFILLDATKDKCFGNTLSRFILEEFVGYDQIIIGSLKRLAERQSGKGYVRNVVSGEHYRFVNSWMSRTSYLAAGFIMIIFTLSVSMLLRYSHHQIFVFIVDLLRMLENNLQFSFPAAPLLTVVLALVGMEAIMSEFFNDTSTAFYTILIIWLADQYEAVCCRTYVSKRHWPRYFYLYHFAFYAYHYRFNGQFSGLALLCSWLFIQHSMFFFFHHYELPRLMQGIAVRAIMDSLIVERAENASLTPTSGYRGNDDGDDDNSGDRPGGDGRDNNDDNDDNSGSSAMPSLRATNGTVPRMGDYKPPSHHDNITTPSHQSGADPHSPSNNNNNSDTTLSTMKTKKRFTIKKSIHPPSFIVKRFSTELKKTNLNRKDVFHIAPNFIRFIISHCEYVVDGCVLDNVGPVAMCSLCEDIEEQVYSIIAIWITMMTMNGSMRVVEDQYHRDWLRQRNSALEESIWNYDHGSMKYVDDRRMEREKPHFTVSRDYHDNYKDRRSMSSSRKMVSKQKLGFSVRQAMSMKLYHQESLSSDMISASMTKEMYCDVIKALGRLETKLAAVAVVSSDMVQSGLYKEMIHTEMELAATKIDCARTMEGDTYLDESDVVKNVSDEERDDVIRHWSKRNYYESFSVHASESMELDKDVMVARVRESMVTSEEEQEEKNKRMVVALNAYDIRLACELCARRTSRPQNDSNDCSGHSTISVHVVTEDNISPSEYNLSINLFPLIREPMSSTIDVEECNDLIATNNEHEQVKTESQLEATLYSQCMMNTVWRDLTEYLTTVMDHHEDNINNPMPINDGDHCTSIPLFDLFPEDY